jgi:pyruvate,water dikinase
MSGHSALILWLADVTKEDISAVGKHALSLGELTSHGFPIADGFVITSRAYYQFLQENNLADKINGILASASYNHPDSLMQISSQIRKLFMHGKFSQEFIKELDMSYKRIGGVFHQPPVIIRSSVTARDLPTVSFAGHHYTFTDVQGEANLILKTKETWASFFDPQALLSRHHQQFDHFHIAVPVIVQKMVHPDKSGFMFTEDPFKGDKSKIIIDAVAGPVQPLIEGKVTPDHYVIHKKDLSLARKEAKEQVLTDNQLMDLALLGRKLDKLHYFPQSITWAIEKRHIFLLDTKQLHLIDTPEQTHDMPSRRLKLLLQGASVSPGLVTGPVRIIHTIHDAQKVIPGDVAVLQHINVDFANYLKKAGAIIADQGGRTSHTSIMIRHMGIPSVVGCTDATEKLRNGTIVTVNASRGEIYEGSPHKPSTEEDDSQVSSLPSDFPGQDNS